jgi:hypothetical protein
LGDLHGCVGRWFKMGNIQYLKNWNQTNAGCMDTFRLWAHMYFYRTKITYL